MPLGDVADAGSGKCRIVAGSMLPRGVDMKIVVVGRGNVGGGLARLWMRAGHDVTAFGQDGGDGSGAEVIVVAVPGSAIPDALEKVTGIDGKITIDATNSLSGPNSGFDSLALQVKSIIGGPTAKCFNTNFASLYEQIAEQRVAPTSVFAADPDARGAAERLVQDAGFDPLHVGGLENAPTLEAQIAFTMMLARGDFGPYFYRFARPGDL
jgi:8-hydroxy-5-deazaflavin:NADPH oxidoreductase